MANTKKATLDKVRPNTVSVMGINYDVEYVDDLTKTDINGHRELLGQCDYMTRTIRLYVKNEKKRDSDGYTFHLLMHEMLHAIGWGSGLKCLMDSHGEDVINVLATILADTLVRNGMIKEEWELL